MLGESLRELKKLVVVSVIGGFLWRWRKNLGRGSVEGRTAKRASPGSIENLVQYNPDIVTTLGADGTLRYGNPSVERVLGYRPEEETGANAFDYIHPDDVERASEALVEGLASSGVQPPVELRFRHSDGSWRYLEVIANNLLSDPNVRGIVLTSRDVTERKRMEEELLRSEARNEAILGASPDLTFLFNRTGEFLSFKATGKEDKLYVPPEAIVGRKLSDMMPAELADTALLHIARALDTGEMQVYEYQLPVPGGGIGWFEARFVKSGANEVLSIVRDTTDRKRAEQTLYESEERFRTAFENASAGMALVGLDRRYLRVNHSLCEKLGYSEEELLSKTSPEITHPEDLRAGRIRAERMLVEGEPDQHSMEKRYIHKDGHTVWMISDVSLVRDSEGTPSHFVSQFQDFTDRKRAEEALRRSEAGLARAQRLARLGSWEWDVSTGESAWSDEAYRVLGFAPQEFTPTFGKFLEVVHPDDRGLLGDEVKAALGGGSFDLEHRLVLPDGEVRVVHCRGEVAFGEGGEPLRMVGTVHDVTERKEAEESLRESETRYRAVIERMADGLFLADMATDCVLESNAALQDLLGYTAEELLGMSIHEFIADERETIADNIRRLREGGSFSFVERRYRRKDGSLADVEVGATVIPYGDRETSCCIVHDVSARKRFEEDLRESEERFRMLFEQSVDYLVVHDAAGKVIDVNSETCRSLGYSREEMLSMYVRDYEMNLLSAEEREKQERQDGTLWQRIAAGEPDATTGLHRGEHRRKDGTTFPVEVRVGGVVYGGERMILASARDVTERKRLEERLVHQALHDPLTGLPNRNLALDRLQQALARARRTRGSAAVLFLDLDNFKVINDSLGHEMGDRLLTAAAWRLRECVRSGETAARLGGDEFAVVLDDVTGKDEAVEVAERVEERFRVPFVLDDRKLFVGTSIGIAVGDPAEDDRPDELMRKADLAMYRAKRRGKARYEVFEAAMSEEVQGRLRLENDLRSGFERGEFELYYQPKVSVEGGVVVAFEALLRWEHPERGLLLPQDFIQTVEEMGLIVPLGRWALHEACRQVKEWHERYPGDHFVVACVNVSSKQLEQTDLVEALSEVLNETGLEPRCLALELTEGAFIGEDPGISNTLRRVRELGVKLVIDDFGIGYSSLSYLRRLPVNFLKLDRSFTEKLGQEHEETTIVRAILEISHALGIKVTAEGVETEDQLSWLRRMGCDLAQGHYFARPMPAREVAAYLTKGLDR